MVMPEEMSKGAADLAASEEFWYTREAMVPLNALPASPRAAPNHRPSAQHSLSQLLLPVQLHGVSALYMHCRRCTPGWLRCMQRVV